MMMMMILVYVTGSQQSKAHVHTVRENTLGHSAIQAVE
jgi:hypothetical protein